MKKALRWRVEFYGEILGEFRSASLAGLFARAFTLAENEVREEEDLPLIGMADATVEQVEGDS